MTISSFISIIIWLFIVYGAIHVFRKYVPWLLRPTPKILLPPTSSDKSLPLERLIDRHAPPQRMLPAKSSTSSDGSITVTEEWIPDTYVDKRFPDRPAPTPVPSDGQKRSG